MTTNKPVPHGEQTLPLWDDKEPEETHSNMEPSERRVVEPVERVYRRQLATPPVAAVLMMGMAMEVAAWPPGWVDEVAGRDPVSPQPSGRRDTRNRSKAARAKRKARKKARRR